jgi:hypothetical protein
MGRPQFVVVLAGLAAVVLVSVLAISSPYFLDGLYLRYRWGPTLEREFGFTAEERVLSRGPGVTERYLVIATTVPEGLLDRSGVRADDVPLNCHHGCTFGFYSALMSARQDAGVRLRILGSADLAQDRASVREVIIVSPGERTARKP